MEPQGGPRSLIITYGAYFIPPAVVLYYVALVIYRVFFHPLAKFPGPKKAAATGWYRSYYDVWMQGEMPRQIAVLHKKYGRIVRFGPNHLHFSEPSAYHEIYANNSKLLKDSWVYNSFNASQSGFAMVDPSAAKGRRDVLSSLFSHRAISSMQGLLAENFDLLCTRLAEHNTTSSAPINLSGAIRSTTVDIITTFCFAQSMHALDVPGFKAPILLGMRTSLRMIQVFKHFPLIQRIVLNFPRPLLMFGEVAGFIDLSRRLESQVANFLKNPADLDKTPHPIIYNRLLDPDAKGSRAAPITQTALEHEAHTMLFAGADTVALTMTVGLYQLLKSGRQGELVEELIKAWPELDRAPKLEELEKLPFLSAVIKESLRMGSGVVSLLDRKVPKSGAVIDGEQIPGGAVVAMGTTIVHTNEDIFPNSGSFIPERWTGPNGKELERYLVPFSKGARQCLGINLGYAELYIGFARLFRRFEITLDGTTEEDMRWKDYFVPLFEEGHMKGFVKPREA
ncbi:uncharacterized protein LAJ45_05308 [Morchella importuna]|uniref:uncharacterized protein n=1 Tax=Morchella importuna TaxID=1174673 RepID=UPI001E8DB41E|nr:uncharacterized protein LAJ45_05308 [Morchella importuna]KAH8150612.1 hypothetical protein LAJ45_05308 [Morchella importuna]